MTVAELVLERLGDGGGQGDPGAEDDAQRRGVVASDRLRAERERALQQDRHGADRVGAVALDVAEELLGIEVAPQHDLRTGGDRQQGHDQARAVEERRADHGGSAAAHRHAVEQAAGQRVAARLGAGSTLRRTRRAAGEEDQSARACRRRGVRCEPVAMSSSSSSVGWVMSVTNLVGGHVGSDRREIGVMDEDRRRPHVRRPPRPAARRRRCSATRC
jgi:hypothetical protein